jgi:hypothetical protein
VSSFWGEAVNCWRLALSEADDLAVGRGDDDLALGDGRLSVSATLYSPVMIPTVRVVLEMKRAGNL